MKPRLLVTGANGFIGEHIIREAVSVGWHITGCVRDIRTMERVSDEIKQNEGTLEVLANIALDEVSCLAKMFGDAVGGTVVHAASQASLATSSGSDLVARMTSEILNVIQACKQAKVKRLVVFGSALSYRPGNIAHMESEELGPQTDYGLGKALCSRIANHYDSSGLSIVELRLFNVYGPNDRHNRIVSYCVNQALRGDPIELNSPNVACDFVYIDDVVKTVLAASSDKLPSGTYNVATAVPTSVLSLAKMVISQTNSSSEIMTPEPTKDAATSLFGSNDKLAVFNLEPKFTLLQGLNDLVETKLMKNSNSC